MDKQGYWYLASPYTSRWPREREERFRCAALAAAALCLSGTPTHSPIVEGHALSKVVLGIRTDHATWWQTNKAKIKGSCGLMILQIDGWDKSEGVLAEIAYAKHIGLTTKFITMEEVETLWRQVVKEMAA